MPLPADLDGARLPPPDSPAYIVDAVRGANTLGVYKLAIDWACPGKFQAQ
jgi:hypothetical protein